VTVERVSPKVFAPGGSGPDGQSAFASDGRAFFQRDETSRRNGAITGASAAVAQFGRVGAWGEQVLGKIASKKTVIIMLFFPSLARGWGGFNATERAHKRSRGRVSRNAGGEVWSDSLNCPQMEPNGKQ